MTKQPKTLGRLVMRAAPLFNAPVAALATSPRFGGLVNRNIAILGYTGRRSGRTFSTPVAYRAAVTRSRSTPICRRRRRGGATSSATAVQ